MPLGVGRCSSCKIFGMVYVKICGLDQSRIWKNLDMSGHAVQILESGQPCTSIWTKSGPSLDQIWNWEKTVWTNFGNHPLWRDFCTSSSRSPVLCTFLGDGVSSASVSYDRSPKEDRCTAKTAPQALIQLYLNFRITSLSLQHYLQQQKTQKT